MRLDKEISNSNGGVARARLLAEKACYLVRIGESKLAEDIHKELRAEYGDGRDLQTSIRIMVLEGLTNVVESLSDSANDRFMRAQFLSEAAGIKQLVSLTSAWLGHTHLNQGRALESIYFAEKAIGAIQVNQWDVLARVSLILGDLFIITSNRSASRVWYELARVSAVEYGDQATIGAVTYNQAALRAFDLRLEAVLGREASENELDLVDAEYRSANNYQISTGMTSLEHLLTAARISIHLLRKNYEAAAAILFPLIDSMDLAGIPRDYANRSVLQADAINCATRVARPELVERFAKSLPAEDIDRLPLYDKIIVVSTLNSALDHESRILKNFYVRQDISAFAEIYSMQKLEIQNKLTAWHSIPEELKWRL